MPRYSALLKTAIFPDFVPRHMVGPDGQENIPHRAWVLMFEEAVSDIKAEMRELGREDEFCGARVRSDCPPGSPLH
jgi:hypothetical protein